MNAALKSRPLSRAATILAFVSVFVGGFVYLWNEVGGWLPDTGEEYQVTLRSEDTKNLLPRSDVSIAGVVVGEVADQTIHGDHARLTLNLYPEAAPLHRGAQARIGVKSVLGQSYVDIVDGDGPPIPDGATLPGSSLKPPVDVDEVVSTFDPATRKALKGAFRSLGTATAGTHDDISRLMSGLGDIGRSGYTVLDAIAAQKGDLAGLVRETTTLLNTLDTGQGQIATMVKDASGLAEATAGQRRALEYTMRAMPPLLDRTRAATRKVGELSASLAPVATDLNRAAPDVNVALQQLPSVTDDLRGMLPALDGTLEAAPATLDRVPTFGSDLRNLVPGADLLLRDVNPMLTYLKPYGRDIGAMTASFGASMDMVVENGVRPLRLAPIFNSSSVRGLPLSNALDPMHWNNPYPDPGQAGNPQPFTGEYPRVERAPK